jgi:hypothetical protein
LFAEADRWVREIDKSNWIPTSQAPTIFPDGQERSISDLLGDALNSYKEARRQYRASLIAFPRLAKILQESKQECAELDDATKKNPDGTINAEDIVEFLDGPLVWEELRRESIEKDSAMSYTLSSLSGRENVKRLMHCFT